MAGLGFTSNYRDLDSITAEMFMTIEAELGQIRKNESKRKKMKGGKK